ncbi:MAG: hypothetical protein PHQ09_04925 [Actinomycetota bacterium]|nr:hypothetical protein [Actinomycetota bacterium]
MTKNTYLNNKINGYVSSFNIILADKDFETFEKIQNLKYKYNFINLSSNFAVNFILEYEKIDLIIISKKISDLSDIVERAKRKKINIYVIGEDIKSPIDEREIENILLKEIDKKAFSEKNKRFNFKRYISYFSSLMRSRKLILKSDSNKDEKIHGHSSIKDNKQHNLKNEKRIFNKTACKNDLSKESKVSNVKNKKYNSKTIQKNINIILENESNPIKDNDLEIRKIRTIKQKVIILVKTKGGVGTTTISIFLGQMFSKVKTLLVDLNFSEGGGDLSYYLNIPKSPNILNFIDGYNRNSLENSVVKIKENLDILQAPPTYEMSRRVDLQDLYCLTDIAKKKYHLVIFDLPNRFDDLLLGLIDLADLLIMVSDHTFGSIGRLIKMNNRFVYDDLERILIINKYDKTNDLNLFKSQIEQFFNLKDFVFLDENEILRKKSEFLNFDFNNLKNFNYLAEKILNLLTCD